MDQTTLMTETANKTIMFYDNGCPICRREVAHYQRLDRAHRVRWVDICEDKEILKDYGLNESDAMARLHAIDSDGRMVKGAWAFAAVWEALPRYRYLAKLLQNLRLLPLLNHIYGPFARWRYRRRCIEISQKPQHQQNN